MTAYEHLLELAADRVHRRGATQCELLCPAHEDRTPSLSLSIGRDENAVIHCHAGCPAADVMAAWPGGRLPVAALYDVYWNRDRDRELEATYDYLDEAGRLLFQVVRKPGKQFRQRRPDRAGGWVWNLAGTRRVLYRLPRVLEAVAAGATVYVCEGEKDVHALEAAGVTATCNPGGAGKWRDEYAQPLEGARVVVVRDRDDTGRRHADAVVASLRGQGMFRRGDGAARSVGLVEPATGKDAADHLAAGRTVEQFVEVAGDDEPAPPPSKPRPPRASRATGDLVAPVLAAMGGYVLLADTDPVRAAIGCAATSELDGDAVWVLLVGGPSCGKTETIDVLRDAADGHIKALTGPGLLSWKAGAGKKARAVGLLARLGDGHHFASITDLSSLLAKSERGGRDDAFALLRDAYDGNVIRDLGTAPEPLRWSGRLTLIGATTPAIDQYASHQDALGPRWAYLRLPELAPEHSAAAAALAYARVAGKSDAQARARALATDAVEQARARIDPDAGSSSGADAIIAAARLAARGRSVVPREGSGHRDVCGDPVIEEPMRLVAQARTLYVGLLAVGTDDAAAARIAARLALDCMPPVRRKLLAALLEPERANISELARRTGSHRHVVERTLEDLELLELTRELGGNPAYGGRDWRLHERHAGLARDALEGVARNVGYPPPSPPIGERAHARATHTSCHPSDDVVERLAEAFEATELDADDDPIGDER